MSINSIELKEIWKRKKPQKGLFVVIDGCPRKSIHQPMDRVPYKTFRNYDISFLNTMINFVPASQL